MAEDSRFPIEIDFSDVLADEGVSIPAACIVIHSTYWVNVNDPDGKPEYEAIDRISFFLGDNETHLQMSFAHMLANFDGHTRNRDWFYNKITATLKAQLAPPSHPIDRILRKER